MGYIQNVSGSIGSFWNPGQQFNWTTPTTAGNLIIFGFGGATNLGGGAPTNIVDSSGTNSYTILFQENVANAGPQNDLFTFGYTFSGSSSTYIEIQALNGTLGGTWNAVFVAAEYSGYTALDASAFASSTTGSAADSGPFTTTQANDLIVGWSTLDYNNPGTGFTARYSAAQGASGYAGLEDMVAVTPGSYDATMGATGNFGWMICGAAFKTGGTPANLSDITGGNTPAAVARRTTLRMKDRDRFERRGDLYVPKEKRIRTWAESTA